MLYEFSIWAMLQDGGTDGDNPTDGRHSSGNASRDELPCCRIMCMQNSYLGTVNSVTLLSLKVCLEAWRGFDKISVHRLIYKCRDRLHFKVNTLVLI